MSSAAILIGLFLLGVVLTAFFAGYETGFVSCNPIRVRHMSEKEQHAKATRLLRYLNHPEHMLTVVLLGTNFAMVMGVLAITRQVGSVWATLIATPVFLVFGEILPKSMFRLHPTRLALGFIPLIHFFDALFRPIAVPVNWISRKFVSIVQGEQREMPVLMRSSEDMRVLVDESADRGAIEPEEKQMIHSVMDLQRQYAKEVMVPRIGIQALPATASRSELIALFIESGRTRIPIYEDSIDEIVGVVNAFDVLRDDCPENQDIRRFVNDITHVPDTMRLDDVLKTMRDTKQSTVIVTDEYGGTDGLLTIEDILEEIFGEIHDEYDQEEPLVQEVGPGDYLVDARASLEDASEAIHITIADGEVETVGGWVMHVAGRIPQKGEVVQHERFRITVLDAGPNRVSSIRLEVLPTKERKDGPHG